MGKKNDLCLAVVLDKSGSMMSCRDATISAFNEYMEDRKKEKGNTRAWLTVFDFRPQIIASGVDVKEIPVLDTTNYSPSGNTALYDAVGSTIRAMEALTSKKDKVLFVIQTDGFENASKEWKREDVVKLIKEKEELGNWTFVYLGADQDAMATGASIGMRAGNTMSYGREETTSSIKTLSAHTNSYRGAAGMSTANFIPEADRDLRRTAKKVTVKTTLKK